MKSKTKYIIKSDGGLGNQMFEYAWARAMQQLYGGEIWLDAHTYKQKGAYRDLSLMHFNLNKDVHVVETIVDRVMLYFAAARKRITDKLFINGTQETYLNKIRWGVYNQYSHIAFDCFIEPKRKINYINGSWFGECFFEPANEVIKKEFMVKTPPSDLSLKLIDEMQSCESVCLHVRLGDFLNEPWNTMSRVCGNRYYNEAIRIIKEKVKDPVFYVFSNRPKDFEYFKTHFELNASLKLMNFSNPDYEDLRLMYNCKHMIMSNSTYSWWAQYLNSNPNKVVVAPCMLNKHNKWDISAEYLPTWDIVGPEYLDLEGMSATKEMHSLAPSIPWERVEKAYEMIINE